MKTHQEIQNKSHDPYEALRLAPLRRYLVSNFLVILGTQMAGTALSWELYERTGQALDLGLLGFFWAAPFIAFAPLGGNVADRFDRRIVITLSALVYSLCLMSLAMASHFHSQPGHFSGWVFATAFMAAASNAFYIPSKGALFNQLVPRKTLPNAVTWGSSTFQLAAVMGPAICGLLLTRVPCSVIYSGAILFELLFVGVIYSLRLEKTSGKKAPITLQSLSEGAKFVWHTKPILATITLDLFAVLLGGCTALLPIFVKDILHSGPEALGWLRSAPSVGALLMAVLVARTPMKKPGLTLLWAVGGFGAATIVFGVSTNLWLSLAMMFVIGALDNISVIIRGTLVQVLTPDRLLGRVQAVNYVFISSSNDLGAFESGIAAALVGPVPAVVLGGFASVGIVLLANWLWPQVAKLKSLQTQKRR